MWQQLQAIIAGAGLGFASLFLPYGPTRADPYPVQIIDSGVAYTIVVTPDDDKVHATVRDILADAGITLGAEDVVSPAEEVTIPYAATIVIMRPAPITVAVDGAQINARVFSDTVGEAIAELGLILGEADRLEPVEGAPLTPGNVIRVIRVVERKGEEIRSLPPPEVLQRDPERPWGERFVIDEGAPGKDILQWRIRYEDGEETQRTLVSRTRVAEPKPRIVAVGAKIEIGRTQEGGASWYHFRKGMYAASTTFPRGTFVRVTSLESGKQIIVKINDYGPTIPGRVIDLEATAFRALAPLSQGVIMVRVEELL